MAESAFSREGLSARIELYESRRYCGLPVKVLALRLGETHALADLSIGGMRKTNQKYKYSKFYYERQLKLAGLLTQN